MDTIVKALGLRIRKLRKETRMSQEELAFKAGLNAAHFGLIERGLKKPTIETVSRIAEALEIPIDKLFKFDDGYTQSSLELTPIMNKIIAQITPMSEEQQKDILKLIKVFKHFRDMDD